MVSGAMLMEIETVLQTQAVIIKEEDKTVNASLPPNQRGDLGTSRILLISSLLTLKSDLLEEDAMGNEPGLVFFEDGSYSWGPVNIPVGEVDDSKYYLTPTFKFEQVATKDSVLFIQEFNNGGSDIQVVRVAVYEEQWVSPANIHDHSDFLRETYASELTGSWKVFRNLEKEELA
ncbi:hypothetical protein GH714_039333 [Hevea brasiliensis]|uniref:Uncharacterized protein n=1 Tax=Hevea brasiliensis TaxID=3981 RepID=A0A6A6MP06_HEVBR|nr:hypothetical protein GH714_039333 [Hevea brasiliensis]